MNNDTSKLIHKQIILDLTKRTLERDKKKISGLKMQRAFSFWFDTKIKELHNELNLIKSQLSKLGIKIQAENKVDDLITEYVILERGSTYTLRYMNVALRNQCEDEVKQLLELK
ncbi:hypothetical protein JOD29_000487 [Lysinibacillus composti]|uniref:Uncharacterized protein n=1 Tax=Lysinibacillus composti TaxID=720633 RepID=A0A3N9UJI1_9BACI|nr:hypothetical protein [Lysinibacillus composti]MBM7607250.1 hypothetical protein [Lysinibacillus composti]RQW76173.1 hypothetical protein EBB45_01080 [Lysinibacillus composti]